MNKIFSRINIKAQFKVKKSSNSEYMSIFEGIVRILCDNKPAVYAFNEAEIN